jgi:hypothetical protein
MAHYSLKITIQATRLPDPVPIPVHDPGKDPILVITEVMREMAPKPGMSYMMGPYRESGLTLNKEAEITAQSFQELARVMGQFDELADQVQCSNPVENS